MRQLFTLCCWSAILWIAGAVSCLQAPTHANGKASLRILEGSSFCGRTEPAALVSWAGDAAAYRRLVAAHNLQGPPPPDFAEEVAVLVALGQRPTLGYGLEPTAEHVPVENGVAIIPVKVSEPPRGALVGQALTSPCLLLAIEREEVSALRIEDQDGNILGQVRIH